MARPVRCRRICVEPKYDSFVPCGVERKCCGKKCKRRKDAAETAGERKTG